MKYRALLRWITGRRAPVEQASIVFTAVRGTLATPIAFGVAGAVEIVAVHFLVPWPWLQWTLLVLSVWGLVSFAAILATQRVHPHVLSPTALTLRSSGKVVAEIPREVIARARIHRRYGVVSAELEKGRLFLPTQDGTNVDVELSAPVDVRIDAPLARWRIDGTASTLSVQVDDPDAFTRALAHGHGPAPSPRSEPRRQRP